ncbi:MAG: hypothetical protein V1767_02055 [Chloroflexota bacterium]
MENSTRYYFWETVPHYGTRQMGKTDGYATKEELKKDMETRIKSNRERGCLTFILEATVCERLV